MNRHPSRVGAPPPTPPPPTTTGYSSWPANQPGSSRPRRWPALLIAASAGALVAAAAAAVTTVQLRDEPGRAQASPSSVTITVEPPAPSSPAPLPNAEADRLTCEQGWMRAGDLIAAARRELATTPAGLPVTDPAIGANPQWTSAVDQAGDLYRQAGDTLAASIAPGTTPVLAEASNTAADAARLLGDAISSRDPINGNAGEIANEAAAQMGALCQRLAPR